MSEVQEFLPEPEARELLHAFLGNIATDAEESSYEDFLRIASDTQLPLSVGSVISHHGSPNPHFPGQIRISAKNEGWKLSAYNDAREYYRGSTISRSHRRFGLGPKERSLVMFHRTEVKGAMALEDTPKAHQMYLIDQASPDYGQVPYELADRPIYLSSYSGSRETSSVTSFSMMAAEARLHAPETLAGFLRISKDLVGRLLTVTESNQS